MTPEEMKRLVRNHFEDFVNRQDAAAIRRNMTAEFVDHDGPGGKTAGVEADERIMRAMYQSMPDLKVTIDDMVAEGDKVVCRNTWRWKDGASGRAMQFRGFVEWRIENGKIAERWAAVTAPGLETA